jgi:hypothetical protein
LGVEVVLGSPLVSPALIDHRTWIESALATTAVENDADGLRRRKRFHHIAVRHDDESPVLLA